MKTETTQNAFRLGDEREIAIYLADQLVKAGLGAIYGPDGQEYCIQIKVQILPVMYKEESPDGLTP
jgi:hypothetical protein